MTTKAEQKIADSQREHVQKLSRPTFEETKATSFCSSCNRFLWGSDRHELPVKLPCGHVVGSACLVKLIAHEQSFDGCPTCRDVYLNSANFWYKKLLECDLRRPGEQKRLSKPEMWWALGADDMWQDFCKDMVRYVSRDYSNDFLYTLSQQWHFCFRNFSICYDHICEMC